MDTKSCRHCKQVLPVSQFYPDTASKDGYGASCKACRAQAQGKVYRGVRNKHRRVPSGYKWCPKCEQSLHLEAFSRCTSKASGYQSHCKTCRQAAGPKGKPREELPQGMKRCWDCERVIPATSELFSVDKRSPDGLQGRCRVCFKAYRDSNRERINKRKMEHYYTHRDEIREKTKSVYYEDHEQSKAERRKYYEQNKDRVRIRQKAYYEANRDKLRAYRIANREWYREYNRTYRLANYERILQRHRAWSRANAEKKREWANNYRKANPDKVRESKKRSYRKLRETRLDEWRLSKRLTEIRRRARKRNLPDNFGDQEWDLCLAYWQNRCAVCGADAVLHLDHWIPLSSPNCPGTVAWNMLSLCVTCNLGKHAKNPEEWLLEKLGQEAAQQKLAEIEAYFEYVKSLNNKEQIA